MIALLNRICFAVFVRLKYGKTRTVHVSEVAGFEEENPLRSIRPELEPRRRLIAAMGANRYLREVVQVRGEYVTLKV